MGNSWSITPRLGTMEVAAGRPTVLLVDVAHLAESDVLPVHVQIEPMLAGPVAGSGWVHAQPPSLTLAPGTTGLFVLELSIPADAAQMDLDLTCVVRVQGQEGASFRKPVLVHVHPQHQWRIVPESVSLVLPWDEWTDIQFNVTGPSGAGVLLVVIPAPKIPDDDLGGPPAVPEKFPVNVRGAGGLRVMPNTGKATFTVQVNPGQTHGPLVGELQSPDTGEILARSEPIITFAPDDIEAGGPY